MCVRVHMCVHMCVCVHMRMCRNGTYKKGQVWGKCLSLHRWINNWIASKSLGVLWARRLWFSWLEVGPGIGLRAQLPGDARAAGLWRHCRGGCAQSGDWHVTLVLDGTKYWITVLLLLCQWHYGFRLPPLLVLLHQKWAGGIWRV